MADEVSLVTHLNKAYVPVTSTQQLVYVLMTARPSQSVSQIAHAPELWALCWTTAARCAGDKIERLKEAMRLALAKADARGPGLGDRLQRQRQGDCAARAPMSEQRALADQIARIRAGGGTQMAAA